MKREFNVHSTEAQPRTVTICFSIYIHRRIRNSRFTYYSRHPLRFLIRQENGSRLLQRSTYNRAPSGLSARKPFVALKLGACATAESEMILPWQFRV